MSILSQLNNDEEKIISGYPMNGNISSIDKYNYNDTVNILEETDYNVSFELNKKNIKNKCLCINNNNNKLSIDNCGTDNCKFKIKSEIPNNNYNDTNKSIRGESNEGIIINLTYNNESSDKLGLNMLNITNYSSSIDDITMELVNPGIKCYDKNKLKNDYSKGLTDATLNDLYRNNSTCTHIELYCYMLIIKDGTKYYFKKNNNNDILFEKTSSPTKWILKFINTKSRFNKCYILIDEGNKKYLSKTINNTLQLTNIEKNATLFNFRVKKDIDNYKFLFINDKTDPNNNLISLRSYNNVNEDTNKLYNFKFNLNVEKNGKFEKKQINIEDTILVDENNNLTISTNELLDSILLSKKIKDVENDILSKYNNNYKFLIDYATFRNNLDELKTVARYYRNLIRNIDKIENKLLKPFTYSMNKLIAGQQGDVKVITELYQTCIELRNNYENILLKKDTSNNNNNTFLKSLSNAIIDENKINFLIGINEFNFIGLLQFAYFFKDKSSMYYRYLLHVYLLNFELRDNNYLHKIFKNNKKHLNLQSYINNDNKNFLQINKNQLHNFNNSFQNFEYNTKDFSFLKYDIYEDYINLVDFINIILVNNVTKHSYNNITNLYNNFDSIKNKIGTINNINFGFSINLGGINNLKDFYTEVYKELNKFGIEFIRSALSSPSDELYIIMNEIFNSTGEPLQTGNYVNIKRVEYFVKLYKNITRYNENDIINNKRKDLIRNLSFENYTNINELENGIFRIYYFKVLNKFLNDIYINNKDAISHLSVSIQNETLAYSSGLAGVSTISQEITESFKNREGFEIPKPKNFLKENNTLKNILNKNKMIYYTNLDGKKIQVDNIEKYTKKSFIKNQNIIDSITWSDDYSSDSKYKCTVDNSEHEFLINYKYKCLDNIKNKLTSQPVSLNYNSLELGDCTKDGSDVCSFKYKCKLIINGSNDKVFLKLFDDTSKAYLNELELISLNDYYITKNDLVNFDDCLNLSQTTSFKNENVINTTILSDYDDETNDEINSLCSINDIIDTSINSIDKLKTLYKKNKNSSSKHLYLTSNSNKMCLVIRDGKFKLIYVTKKKKKINYDELSRISGEREHSSQIIDNVNYGDTDVNEFYLYKNPNYTSNDDEQIAKNISKFGYVDIKGQFHKLEDGLINKISSFYDISDTKYCLDEKYVNPDYADCDDEESCLGRLSIDGGCGDTGTDTKCYMIDDIKNLYISHTGACVTENTGESDSGKFEQKRYSIKRDSSDINSYSHITNSEKTHTITNTKYLELMNNYLSSDNFDTSSFLNNISNSVKEKYDTLRKENNDILKKLIKSYNELSEEEMNIVNKSTEMKEDLQKNILENYKKNVDNIDKANKYINLEEGRENQYRNLKRESDYKLALMGIVSITSVIMLLHYTKK